MLLISTQCFPPNFGGIQAVMAGLARSATERGVAVTVVADAASGSREHDATANYNILRYGGPKPLRRRMKAHAVRRMISTGKPGILVCDTWKSLEHLAVPCMPTIVFAHGMEFPAEASPRKLARIARAMGNATAVIAASRYAEELVRPYVPLDTTIAVVNPPLERFPDATESAAALRARYGQPLLVGLARLEPRKGFDRVIEALPLVEERHPGVSFLIGGDGSDKARLQDLAQKLGVASRVHFLGRVGEAEKLALLAAGDLFVMPTRRVGSSVEGFGIVYAEAAWFGVPAVAGIEGGAGDFVEEGVTGRLVDGHRPIADTLLDLLADPDRLKSMGRAARAKVCSSGLWDHAFVRLMDLAQSAPRRCAPSAPCPRCKKIVS
jgi:phosphatidylinositol alpha-1,6-mannosyltransferase